MKTMLNAYHIRVKKICASCKHKECMNDGTRVCHKMELKVEQQFKCRQWEMADGLRNAGKGDGVVRLRETKEIVIK